MAIIYGISLLAALLTGGAIGWLLTVGHLERVAYQHRSYENEMIEAQELYMALALLRHIKPYGSVQGDEPDA
jgi:hypothetical protein